MNKPLVIANWKSNPATLKGATLLAEKIERGVSGTRKAEIVIAPPHPFIPAVSGTLKKIKLGAQNCFFAKGPYTGEISAEQLGNLGVEYVIIGHSERKIYLGETDELINKKVRAVLENKMSPVLCVGEKERVGDEIPKVISEQLKNALRGVKAGSAKNIIVAYEPIWAISTMPGARPDTPDNAFRVMLYLRRVLTELFGNRAANAVRIIYGGSVRASNIALFLQEGGMAGALVGGASLDAEEFLKIISLSQKVFRTRQHG